jgi:hypothetical protein
MTRLTGNSSLAYVGVQPASPTNFITQPKDPTTYDWQNFYLGDEWLNSTTRTVWKLVSLSGNLATWVKQAGTNVGLQTLTGNSGGAVSPTLGNINVVGDGTSINIVGTPGTSTLTATATGSFSSPITVPNGGTGDSSFLPYAVITGGITSTGPLQSVASVGTAGQVLTSNGASMLPTFQTPSSSSGHPIVTTYSTPGTFTWTKGSGTTFIEVFGCGGGQGGGSGARGTSNNNTGGSAGGGGNAFYAQFPASFIGATATVVVGLGGAGGAAITTNTTAGNNGAQGTNSSFGDITCIPYSPAAPIAYEGQGGTIGAPGANNQIPGGTAGGNSTRGGFAYNTNGGGPVASGISQNGGGGGQLDMTISYYPGATGGGGGGGSWTSYASIGGDGGIISGGGGQTSGFTGGSGGAQVPTVANNPILYGGVGGQEGSSSINGTNGNNAPTGSGAAGIFVFGTGGGGGGGQSTGSVAGTGGNGGFPGGGGGGGGSSLNGTNSGAGGNGANGIVYVIEW